jgi:hypothetical protein
MTVRFYNKHFRARCNPANLSGLFPSFSFIGSFGEGLGDILFFRGLMQRFRADFTGRAGTRRGFAAMEHGN